MLSAVSYRFFDAVVDINSKKRVIAVSTSIQNDWFLCCARIYSQLGDLFIFPLMSLLGIDGRGSDVDRNNRNWAGVRAFCDTKSPKLKRARDDTMSADDGQNKLLSAVHSRDSFLRCPSSTSTGRLVLAPSMNPNWNLLL